MSTLDVEIRTATGKGVARKLRSNGKIPAVLYGSGKDPVALALDPIPLVRVLAKEGRNALIELTGGVQGRTTLVREFQVDPLKGTAIHADFLEIKQDVAIEVEIPIEIIGDAPGVALHGGVLDHSLRELEIECLPRNIPDKVEVDVSALEIGDSIHVSDLKLPPGIEVLNEPDVTVVSVMAPTLERELAEHDAEAAAEAAAGAEAAPKADADEDDDAKADGDKKDEKDD